MTTEPDEGEYVRSRDHDVIMKQTRTGGSTMYGPSDIPATGPSKLNKSKSGMVTGAGEFTARWLAPEEQALASIYKVSLTGTPKGSCAFHLPVFLILQAKLRVACIAPSIHMPFVVQRERVLTP